MIERLKKHQEEYRELNKQGVLGVATDYIQLDTDAFLEITNGRHKLARRGISKYPYDLTAKIDGVSLITVLTLEEYKDLVRLGKIQEMEE